VRFSSRSPGGPPFTDEEILNMSNNDYPGIDPHAMMPVNYNTPTPADNANTRAAFPPLGFNDPRATNQATQIPDSDVNEHGWKYPKPVLDNAGRPIRPGV
jgi:hypothetical protein